MWRGTLQGGIVMKYRPWCDICIRTIKIYYIDLLRYAKSESVGCVESQILSMVWNMSYGILSHFFWCSYFARPLESIEWTLKYFCTEYIYVTNMTCSWSESNNIELGHTGFWYSVNFHGVISSYISYFMHVMVLMHPNAVIPINTMHHSCMFLHTIYIKMHLAHSCTFQILKTMEWYI